MDNNKQNNTRKETWKTIDGYSNYQVSNKGRVRMVDGSSMEIHLNAKTGYCNVNLKDADGEWKSPYVHRLVAQAFIPNPNNLEQVDHIDGCRTRNCVSNLRWVSRKFNNSRKQTIALKSKNHRHDSHIHQFVKAVDAANGQTLYFKNARLCALGIGCSHVMAIKVLRGEFKAAKGWKLTYIERASEEGRNANIDVRRKSQKRKDFRKEMMKRRKERVKELALLPQQAKRIMAIDPKTNRVVSIYRNMYNAERSLGICNIRDALYGVKELVGGLKWSWVYA